MLNSLKPRHTALRAMGTGLSFTSFVALPGSQYKSNINLVAPLTTQTFSTFAAAQYQLMVTVPVQSVTIDEGLNLFDDVFLNATLTQDEQQSLSDLAEPSTYTVFEEDQSLLDSLDFGLTLTLDEPTSLVDELLSTITYSIEDSIGLDDFADPSGFSDLGDEVQNLADSTDLTIGINVDEQQSLLDDYTFSSIMPFDELQPLDASCKIRMDIDHDTSLQVQLITEVNTESSVEVQITQFTPPPSNILTSPSNPFEPVVVINGVVYAGTPGPGVTDQLTITRGGGVTGNCSAEIISFNVSLNFLGGTFEIQAYNLPGVVVGSLITVCGLPGVVTLSGKARTPDGLIYTINGIFGTREFNREVLLVSHSAGLGGLIRNTPLQTPSVTQWTTLSAAAKALANAAGTQLEWYATDGVLVDMFAETGLTVGAAIQSLAARVGGIVCWTGVPNQYRVISPDFAMGGFSGFPECSLISSLSSYNILDDKRDYVILPVSTGNNSGVFALPSALAPPDAPIIEVLHRTRSKIDPQHPDSLIVLPPDFKPTDPHNPLANNGQIQIRVNPDKFTGQPFTTTSDKPETWFPAGLPVIQDKKNGVYMLSLNSLPFPADLQDDEFEMAVGYVRHLDPLSDAVQQQFSEALERQRTILTIEQEKLRYVKVKGFDANGIFFGAVPLPGQNAALSKSGVFASGLVESVTISGSKNSLTTLSLSGGTYQRVEFLSARQYLDFFFATGAGALPSP